MTSRRPSAETGAKMSHDAERWARAQKAGKASAKAVLIELAWRRNPDDGKCFPSVETLAESLEMDRKTVMGATAHLEKIGLIAKRVVWEGRKKFIFYEFPSFNPAEWAMPSESTKKGCAKNGTTKKGSTKNGTYEGTKSGTYGGTENGTETRKVNSKEEQENSSLSPLAPARDDHAPTAAVDGELFPELQDYGPRMRCEPEKVRQLYNQILPELPECQILSKTRKTHIEARFRQLAKEEGFTTSKEVLDGFRIFFEGVKRSDFLMGRKDPGIGRTRAFRADLDWLMKESNFIKVCEGKYMNSNS